MKRLKLYVKSGTGMHLDWGRGFKTAMGFPGGLSPPKNLRLTHADQKGNKHYVIKSSSKN